MRKAVLTLASLVVLAVPASANASAGLSGWWPFYENAGTTAHDLSGNHHDGTLNGAQWTSGYFGSGLSFDGNGENVQIPDSPSLEPTNAITVTAYVQSAAPGKYGYVIAKGGFGCNTGAYGLYTGQSGGLSFYVDNPDDVSFTKSADAGKAIWDGNWHFVVGTYDGSAVHLYVDGAEVGTGTPDHQPITYGGPTNSDLFIGHYEGCNRGLDFAGSIDEPTVWSRALTAAQVHTAYVALTTLHRFTSRLPAFPVN